MISPDDIRKKALKHWNSQRFLRADLRGETIFPLFIRFKKVSSRQMLDLILPGHAIRTMEPRTGKNAFEKRYFLKYDQPLIRFRLLDRNVATTPDLGDISTPMDQFAACPFPVKKVFITENKINGLSFPDHESAMVIFGLGYGAHILNEIPWLREKEIYYWGDIDTHGFSILSMIRHTFPKAASLLMDRSTFLHFKHLWVEEPKASRTTAILPNLTDGEQTLYLELIQNIHGSHVRLEQERIAFGHLRKALQRISTS